jgi:hypothetical protein
MTLMTLMTLMTPSLPTTLAIHSNSSTSGFWMPSALVNIAYIPTELLPENIQILMFSHAKSEREYDNKGVDLKTSSRKELISYIFS